MSCNCCPDNTGPLIFMGSDIQKNANAIKCLQETMCEVSQNLCATLEVVKNIQMSLATAYPTVVQGEFPDIIDGKIIYHYSGILREIVGNIVVIFRGSLNQALPVFLADNTDFAHVITVPITNDQLLGDAVMVNVIIPAIYEGNYVHLQ